MYDIVYKGLTADESLGRMPLYGRDEYSVSVYGFARNFEKAYGQLYPQTAGRLDALNR